MSGDLLVYEGIVATFQAASQAVTKALSAFELTPAQFGLLRRMADGEVASLTELARRLGCTNANMTRLVDNLVRAGLLERVDHPFDRRVAPVRLTPEGVLVRDRAAVVHSQAVSQLVGRLGEDERAALLALRGRFG